MPEEKNTDIHILLHRTVSGGRSDHNHDAWEMKGVDLS